MKRIVGLFLILVSVFSFFSCEDSDGVSEEPHLIVKFQFDPNQVRLNNLGQPATIPTGHAAQSPVRPIGAPDSGCATPPARCSGRRALSASPRSGAPL